MPCQVRLASKGLVTPAELADKGSRRRVVFWSHAVVVVDELLIRIRWSERRIIGMVERGGEQGIMGGGEQEDVVEASRGGEWDGRSRRERRRYGVRYAEGGVDIQVVERIVRGIVGQGVRIDVVGQSGRRKVP